MMKTKHTLVDISLLFARERFHDLLTQPIGYQEDDGMGTRSSGDSPRRKRATLAIAICNARSTAARVPPAICGVTITWGKSAKGLPPAGSLLSTSSAAPPSLPLTSARCRARSSSLYEGTTSMGALAGNNGRRRSTRGAGIGSIRSMLVMKNLFLSSLLLIPQKKVLFSARAIPCLAFDRAGIDEDLPGSVDAHDRTLLRVVGDPTGIASRGEGGPGVVHAPGEFNRRILPNQTLWAGQPWGIERVENKAQFQTVTGAQLVVTGR